MSFTQAGFVQLWTTIHCYVLAESLFFCYHTYLARIIQARNQLPIRDHHRTIRLFNRALTFGLDVSQEGKEIPHDLTEELDNVKSFREAFAAWFFGHDFKALSRPDVLNWLAWSLLDSDLPNLDQEQRRLVEECCDLVERRGAWKFKLDHGIGNEPKDKNHPHVKCIRLTLDRTLRCTQDH